MCLHIYIYIDNYIGLGTKATEEYGENHPSSLLDLLAVAPLTKPAEACPPLPAKCNLKGWFEGTEALTEDGLVLGDDDVISLAAVDGILKEGQLGIDLGWLVLHKGKSFTARREARQSTVKHKSKSNSMHFLRSACMRERLYLELELWVGVVGVVGVGLARLSNVAGQPGLVVQDNKADCDVGC